MAKAAEIRMGKHTYSVNERKIWNRRQSKIMNTNSSVKCGYRLTQRQSERAEKSTHFNMTLFLVDYFYFD